MKFNTADYLIEKELERMERTIKRDSIAAAYISAGRLDRIFNDTTQSAVPKPVENSSSSERLVHIPSRESESFLQQKQTFLSRLSLVQVTPKYKEGSSYSFYIQADFSCIIGKTKPRFVISFLRRDFSRYLDITMMFIIV